MIFGSSNRSESGSVDPGEVTACSHGLRSFAQSRPTSPAAKTQRSSGTMTVLRKIFSSVFAVPDMAK
jgi:hypothetical protein